MTDSDGGKSAIISFLTKFVFGTGVRNFTVKLNTGTKKKNSILCSNNPRENKIMGNLIKLYYNMAVLKCPTNHTSKSDFEQLQETVPLKSQAHSAVTKQRMCRSIPACFAPGVRLSGVVLDMSALI